MTVTKGGDKKSGESDVLQQLITALGAGGTPGGQVFMGYAARPVAQNPRYMTGAAEVRQSTRKIPKFVSKEDALAEYYDWKPKQQQDFLAKLKVAGLVQADAGSMEASHIWSALVDEAANYGALGKEISPMDILGGYVSAAGGVSKGQWQKDSTGRFEVNALTGERRYIGPQFSTVNNQRIDLTDPATARAIATKMFQDLMGRNPGKGEIGSFANALAEAEQNNPLSETTTTEYDTTTGEAIGTNTTSSGGVSADAKAILAEDQIKKKPEYGVTQAVTTYQGALENAVYGAPE